MMKVDGLGKENWLSDYQSQRNKNKTKQSKGKCEYYRPISLLTDIKMEFLKLIIDCLVNFLEEAKVLRNAKAISINRTPKWVFSGKVNI